MDYFKNKNAGLSLIETIVYIAVLASMLALVVNTLLLVGRSYQDLRAQRLITSSARASLERMTRDVRDSESINQAGSTLGTSPGSLLLNILDASENPTTVEFYTENNTLKVREGGIYTGDLTLGDVFVDNLVFHFVDASSSEAVRIEFGITATSGARSSSESYFTTTVLRESYE